MKTARAFSPLEHESAAETHANIIPLEIRSNEYIKAYIGVSGTNSYSPTQVWRLSPLGIEILRPETLTISDGDRVDLKINLGGQEYHFEGFIVKRLISSEKRDLLAIRFTQNLNHNHEDSERRERLRWPLIDPFCPTGVSLLPGRFNEHLYFRVKDISQSGIQFVTSLRNKSLIPQMRLEASVQLPLQGNISLKLEVVRIKVGKDLGRDVLEVGAKILNFDRVVSESIGQFLLQFGPQVTPKLLREQGIISSSVANAVQFQFVRNEQEYYEVLKLRQLAYSCAGKISIDDTIENRGDEIDVRSRIIIGLHHGRVIASSRMIFSDYTDKMEQEKFTELPENFPRRDECVEITRACVHPDFWRTDVLMEMCKFMAINMAQSKRPYAVICASKEMIPLYKKMGYKLTTVKYPHPGLGNLEHWVMYGNTVDAMLGKGVNPIYWNLIWRDVTKYLSNYDFVQPTTLDLLRLDIYKCFYPFAKILKGYLKKRKKKT